MSTNRIDRVRALLEGIETGDPDAVSVVSPDEYIQHNSQTHTGRDGLAALFARPSKTSPRVNVVRAFEDGDFVFGHTEYDFSSRRIGFEVFRFEGDHAVEHWDNIQLREGPNRSGHSMVNGATEVAELDRAEANRDLVRTFIETLRIRGRIGSLSDFVRQADYTEHDPDGIDGFEPVKLHLENDATNAKGSAYHRLHRVLAHDNFVLSVCGGSSADVHTSFYDLHRVEADRIVEHWITRETVAPPEQWNHGNGKF